VTVRTGYPGTSAVIRPPYVGCNCIDILITSPSASVDSRFLALWINSSFGKEQVLRNQGGLAQKHFNVGDMRNLVVALPMLPEQRAIATALGDVDALLGAQEQLIVKKRNLKQAAMQQLLTGQTRLPGFTERWMSKTLGDVIEKLVGGGTPARNNPAFWGGEIPWVTVKDFATFNPLEAQESITKQGLYKSATHLIPAGTLITSTRMALGKAVIYEVDVAINQDLKALFLKPNVNARFLYYWFKLNEQKVDGLGSGSTVKGISTTALKALPFPLLPMREQSEIVAALADMDKELMALEQRLAKTRDLKQGMMQELLTGRTRLISQEVSKCLSAHALSGGPRTV